MQGKTSPFKSRSLAITASLLLSTCAFAEPVETFLPEKSGFFLLPYKAAGVAPSISLKRIQRGGVKTLEKVISLKGMESGTLLLAMPQGRYSITRVDAPFYDLPYWLDTSKDELWRFEIKAQHVNYVGELVIEGERGRRTINVNLFNRLASNFGEIERMYPQILEQYPFNSGISYQDDFIQFIQK